MRSTGHEDKSWRSHFHLLPSLSLSVGRPAPSFPWRPTDFFGILRKFTSLAFIYQATENL